MPVGKKNQQSVPDSTTEYWANVCIAAGQIFLGIAAGTFFLGPFDEIRSVVIVLTLILTFMFWLFGWLVQI